MVGNTTGNRLFNVSINGASRLSSFDIYAAAGAPNKAVVREFATASNASGQVIINFSPAPGSPDPNAVIHGLEIYTITPFDAWRVGIFTPAQLDNASISGPLADYDLDGMPTLMEYALNTNALISSTGGLPTAGLNEEGKLTLTFLRARGELTYTVEGSRDLLGWVDVAINPGTVGQSVTVPDNFQTDTTFRFLRLQIFP